MRRVSLSAFTLIELLIVVAVISILAAIALPNFLEAQTRAKTAKAKANIRVILDASDAYLVDWNSYPPSQQLIPEDPFGLLASVQLAKLTTPVAYISPNAFRDPFGQVRSQVLTNSRSGDTNDGDFPIPQIPNQTKSVLYFFYPTLASLTGNDAIRSRGMALVSLAPDKLDSFGAYRPFGAEALPPAAIALGILHPIDTQYDPTNGTVSRGDIYGFSGINAIPRMP